MLARPTTVSAAVSWTDTVSYTKSPLVTSSDGIWGRRLRCPELCSVENRVHFYSQKTEGKVRQLHISSIHDCFELEMKSSLPKEWNDFRNMRTISR